LGAWEVYRTSREFRTEPDVTIIEIEGYLLSRESRAPVAATVSLIHRESDGDWVWTSYRRIVDASTQTSAGGWFELSHETVGCNRFILEASAFGNTYTNDAIECVDGLQTITAHLDPECGTPAWGWGNFAMDITVGHPRR